MSSGRVDGCAYVNAICAVEDRPRFTGLTTNTPCYNVSLALAMVVGRFFVIVPILALAGSLVAKRRVPPSLGTLPTTGPLWIGLLLGVIVIVGGLAMNLPRLSARPSPGKTAEALLLCASARCCRAAREGTRIDA